MMKTLVHTVCAVAVMGVPIASMAQSDSTLTRAQVQAEIAQLQQAGYNPANANTVDFPANMQAAGPGAPGQSSGYGPGMSGTSQMGHPASTSGVKPVFFGGS
jgi:Ni/Co efflux regulator RcnB